MNIDVIIDERLIKAAVAKVTESKASSTEDDDGSMTVSPVKTSVITENERKSFVSSSQQPKTASSSRSGSFIIKSTTTTSNNNEDNAQTSDVDEFVQLQHQQSSTMTQMCRICHSDSQTEDMIVPCKCSGSLKYVHQACLQNWLKINGSKSCEICKDEFIIKMRPNALNRWKKPIMTRDQRRKFLLMNFLYLVAILCNLWSINSFSGVLLMQFRLGIYDWKFYMIVFFSLSTLFCIIWFLVSLVQIWFDFFRKCFRYNQSMTIRSKFAN